MATASTERSTERRAGGHYHAYTPRPFTFQDLDSTKPAGSVKIRVETITHYLARYAGEIIDRKEAAMDPGCPLR